MDDDNAVPSRVTEPFRFAYDAPTLRCGRHSAGELGEELAARGLERALVVSGQTVGSTPAVIDPVRSGLDERLAGVFAETTAEKRLATAAAGAERVRELDADCIVALGGGSSLDAAKQVSVLAARAAAADDDPATAYDAAGTELAETGTLTVPETVVPIVAVPTTLAGADVSQGGGVTATPEGGLVGESVSGGLSDAALLPAAVVADSALFATTPDDVLAASAMNGFDKGIETLYASTATPVTDATAIRGLSLYQDGLLAFGDGIREPWVFDALARGSLLVQYGISRPDAGTLSLIHSLSHGLTRGQPIQQGTAHGIVAPHALNYLFEHVDGRRDLLADALGMADADDTADAITTAVADVRDALGLPTRLRDVDGPEPDEFPAVAEAVLADGFMANVPADLNPTSEGIKAVLAAAW
ncbi:alcohol dehydrogenase [Halococcus morrhuae DSM 1307]|uniref:Alcohol dehydrogenase n=1 Tax=Halococcus morrhuae DSM 1307 TaxID=931277 RepID=M0M429_HALMO|nr:iron-containing alcohol dehydrogenase family protein [Halococcus morrhuae]EMA39384.1 alcohol dehydrogenase [Halococcus morrhuae DSM 1307]